VIKLPTFQDLIVNVVGPAPPGLEFVQYIVAVMLLFVFIKYVFMVISIPFNLGRVFNNGRR